MNLKRHPWTTVIGGLLTCLFGAVGWAFARASAAAAASTRTEMRIERLEEKLTEAVQERHHVRQMLERNQTDHAEMAAKLARIEAKLEK